MINALESEDLPFCGKSFIKLPRSIVNRELDTLPAERNIGFIHFVLFGKGNGWRLRAVYKPRLWSLDMKKNAEGKLRAVNTRPTVVHRSICRGDRSEAPANSVKVYMQ